MVTRGEKITRILLVFVLGVVRRGYMNVHILEIIDTQAVRNDVNIAIMERQSLKVIIKSS